MTNKKETKQPDAEVEVTDLQKALGDVEEVADAKQKRGVELLQKGLGGELTAEGKQELWALVGGDEESLVKSVVQDATEGAPVEEDSASDYITWHMNAMKTSSKRMASAIEKSQQETEQTQAIFAKALVEVGKAVEALQKSVAQLAEQPVGNGRAARSRPQAEAIQKSFAGNAPEGEALAKSQVINALEQMAAESFNNGSEGRAPCGEDLTMAVSKYEQFGTVSRPLAEDIKAHMNRA